MTNLREYHESLTAELEAAKNKARNLVKNWQADGEWKEAALRTVLRRHLPDAVLVGRGFVADRDAQSTQIDLLITKPGKPFLFRDGDLAIVTPDVPAVVIEVKTKLRSPADWKEALAKLARTYGAGRRNGFSLGLFCYEGDLQASDDVLDALLHAFKETGVVVSWVACGPDLFVRYWGEWEGEGRRDDDGAYALWRAYHLKRVAPSYFLGNVVEAVCPDDCTDDSWFAYEGGKAARRIGQRFLKENQRD